MTVVCMLMKGLLVILLGLVTAPGSAESTPSDYPQSLERDLKRLREAGAADPSDPRLLIELARVYLDMGDDLWTDSRQRIAAYEEGARMASRALDLEERNAMAHFLYAANAGSAARLKGIAASALTVQDLKRHVKRALQLEPKHALSLHMMGRMLEELPWVLGGDAAAALNLLIQAVAADPNYAHARLDLAKAYLKRGERDAARRELKAVIDMKHPNNPYSWNQRYRPEAVRLLAELEGK